MAVQIVPEVGHLRRDWDTDYRSDGVFTINPSTNICETQKKGS